MSHVFLSHASPDKGRIRPIAEALAREGVRLWLDRPGFGGSHFNFDRGFIEKYEIKALGAGQDWNEAISEGLRDSSAVLFCLSRAASEDRKVLMSELTVATVMRKVVVVVVDDLAFSEFPRDLGLVDLARLHVERLDTHHLAQTLAAISGGRTPIPAAMPPEQRAQWEVILKLKNDLNEIAIRDGRWRPSAEDTRRSALALAEFPIGPMVTFADIPHEVIDLFATRLESPERSRLHLTMAMQIRETCDPEGFGPRIAVRTADLPRPEQVGSHEFWAAALTEAGLKSRRTLAALLLVPGGPLTAPPPPDKAAVIEDFERWLKNPNSS